MKKILIICLTLIMLVSMSACNKTSTVEQLPGGWSASGDSELTSDLIDIFTSAVEGTKLEGKSPVKLIASQVVNGVNYKFLCDDGTEVMIHSDLDGTSYPLNEDYSKMEKESDCDNSKGCDVSEGFSDHTNSSSVKEHYEVLNGTTNAKGKEHRTITLSEDNRFVAITPDELLNLLEKEPEVVVMLSSNRCPWCRSIFETLDSVLIELGIEKLYVLECWDEEGNEIFRDKLYLNDSDELQIQPPHPAYSLLLQLDSKDYFSEVILKNKDESDHPTGKKRIYLPTLIYVKDGVVEAIETATSDLLEDPRGELTPAIKAYQHEVLVDFFNKAYSAE